MKSFKKKTDEETPWYLGGNLHEATLKDWHEAEQANHFATCADWVVQISKFNNLTPAFYLPKDLGFEEYHTALLSRSNELRTAIHHSSENHPNAFHLPISELALLAAYALGWLSDPEAANIKL
jgi:hypothetical protein